MTTNTTPAVYAAISRARVEAAKIALHWTDGAGGNTKGRRSEDLRKLLVQVLPKCGLEIIPGAVRIVDHREATTGKGSIMHHQTLEQEFIVVSTEDGSSITGGSAGSGMDMGDKYTSKALTYAKKSFVLSLLDIPSEEMTMEEINNAPDLLTEDELYLIDKLIDHRTKQIGFDAAKFVQWMTKALKVSSYDTAPRAALPDLMYALTTPGKATPWPDGQDPRTDDVFADDARAKAAYQSYQEVQ